MFDNLNNPNQPGHQPVDDIFADTDQVSDAPKNSAPTEITAQRVGLTASSEMPISSLGQAPKGGNGVFKIIVIVMVLVILGLLGFLIYNKFLKPAPIDTSPVTVNRVATTTNQTPVNNTPAENNVASSTFVAEIPSVDTAATDTVPMVESTSTTVINAEATSTAPEVIVNPVDSDSDGLTDAEEIAAGTNINIIDTDNDGLSDYEEVKIYKTNPLVADTDGDGYTDGQEVRSGYNPNGAGKFPGELIK